MKTSDFIKLEKRLIQNLPAAFAIKARACFIAPIGSTLRGFHFDPSAFNSHDFYVNMFFLPLCVPTANIHLTFGHRIGRERRWSIDQAGLENNLTDEMRKQVPFLTGLNSPRNVVKALHPIVSWSNPNTYEAFAYTLVQAGEKDQATAIIDDLISLKNATYSWEQEIASRADVIKAKLASSIEEAQGQLAAWELQSASSLGLERFG